MSTDTRTPIVWDQSDAIAWERDMEGETTRHGAAMTEQWPTDMLIGYMPQSGVVHMVPVSEGIAEHGMTIPLCGSEMHGVIDLVAIPGCYTPCRVCTTRYNEGATTGVKPDLFPVGAKVEFDALTGDLASTMQGVVVERVPAFRGFRRVQINPAGLCTDIRVEHLRTVQ